MIRGIVFDLDDTLFSENMYVKSGYRAIDDYLAARGIVGFYERAVYYYDSGEKKKVFDKVLQDLQGSTNEKLVMELLEIYRNHQPNLEMHTDALGAIHKLRHAYRLGIITDGFYASQSQKIDALKLTAWFECIVISDEFGRKAWKPSEIPYEKVMQQLMLPGNPLIYVGDNPAKDFITARRLGWHTVWIRRKDGIYADLQAEKGYEADFEIQDLSEVDEIVRRLNSDRRNAQ